MGEGEAPPLQEELVDEARSCERRPWVKLFVHNSGSCCGASKRRRKSSCFRGKPRRRKIRSCCDQLEAEKRRLSKTELQKTWDDMDKQKISFEHVALLLPKKIQTVGPA